MYHICVDVSRRRCQNLRRRDCVGFLWGTVLSLWEFLCLDFVHHPLKATTYLMDSLRGLGSTRSDYRVRCRPTRRDRGIAVSRKTTALARPSRPFWCLPRSRPEVGCITANASPSRFGAFLRIRIARHTSPRQRLDRKRTKNPFSEANGGFRNYRRTHLGSKNNFWVATIRELNRFGQR
jgi:hypothetical protein